MDICVLNMFGVVQVEGSENGLTLVQGNSTDCVCVYVFVSVCAIRCQRNPLHLQRGSRRDTTTKSNNIEHLPDFLSATEC